MVRALGARALDGGMKTLAKSLLGRLGYRVQGTRYVPRQLLEPACLRFLEFRDAVGRLMFEKGPALSFIQVGAFDGVTLDPLQPYIGRHGWRGVMLEPQPQPAARLRELYRGNDRITVLEAALDRQPGTRSLFTVNSDRVPDWARGMASFDREHVAKHEYLIPGLGSMIKEIPIRCVSFDEVLALLGTESVDVLQIDAEGADAYILGLFPFGKVKPPIVNWEVKNLKIGERESCLELLLRYGYRFAPAPNGDDMLAVLD